jgi:hypothetical protein
MRCTYLTATPSIGSAFAATHHRNSGFCYFQLINWHAGFVWLEVLLNPCTGHCPMPSAWNRPALPSERAIPVQSLPDVIQRQPAHPTSSLLSNDAGLFASRHTIAEKSTGPPKRDHHTPTLRNEQRVVPRARTTQYRSAHHTSRRRTIRKTTDARPTRGRKI